MTGVEGLRAALAGRYDVEREVGHGAMATVFLARDLRYDRQVAVKVLNRELAAALGAERFLREIDILARLNHPHILPLLDSGDAKGSLYYVMPFVAGESLRRRLERETQLPVGDALAIAREVALALDYAHRQGFIHRDVKPENILLSDGLALVADFGIARAVNQAADTDRLTGSGLSPGTPPYMSPEQASGGTVDSRCDIYALGCVLYELLAGQPPFPGPTAQAVLARHLADPVPPLRTVRPTVPLSVERAVLKALAKVPADRYATAGEFAAALAAPQIEVRALEWQKPAVLIAAGAAVAAIVWFTLRVGSAGESGAGAAVDSTRYLILPFTRDSGVHPFNEDQLLYDALTRWTGISVVDQFQANDAIGRHRSGPLTRGDALRTAQELGAGRFIRSEVSRVGDSIRVHSSVYDASRSGSLVQESTIKLPRGRAQPDSAFAVLGDGLLFRTTGPGASLERGWGTRSRPGRQAFAEGLDSVYTWNLTGADSAFAAATRYDNQYAQAFLWLAQTRSWMSENRSWSNASMATWQSAAQRAAAGRAQLSVNDRQLAEALQALSGGDVAGACRAWDHLTAREPYDFAAWFGLGNCLSRDDAVVVDRTSLSRWGFRSSYRRATQAYDRAFELLPSIHRSLRGGSYEIVRRLLWTSENGLRAGRAVPPDTTVFAAYASWQGDTLAFVPYPLQQFGQSTVVPKNAGLAVRHQRELFHDIATAWVTAFPKSADAMEALAISLDLLGDPSALDTLRRARSMVRGPEEGLRAANAEVWMRVRFFTPADLGNIRAARGLADSLLDGSSSGEAREPLLLAALAALTGRAALGATLTRSPSASADRGVPPALTRTALPLLFFAALGGPVDSIERLERQVDSAIEASIPATQRLRARLEWLARPATLVFSDFRLETLPKLFGTGDDLLDAQEALARGDTTGVRHKFAEWHLARRYSDPAELPFDALLPEARLLVVMGDDRGAAGWLDPTLSSLPETAPEMFADLPRAGALVRAFALRAEIAERLGDRATAKRWAAVVSELWANADPFLQPLVRRMRRLAG